MYPSSLTFLRRHTYLMFVCCTLIINDQDCLFLIFFHVRRADLHSCKRVSKDWDRVCKDDRLQWVLVSQFSPFVALAGNTAVDFEQRERLEGVTLSLVPQAYDSGRTDVPTVSDVHH